MSDLKIKVISEPSENNPFLIIYKPHNLPSAPLKEGDTENALYQASIFFPEINGVHGIKEIEKGLVHRLDTVTSGLMLIATDQAFYEYIQKIQKENRFIKQYKAFCDICNDNAVTLDGFPPVSVNTAELKCNDIVCTKSCFRPYGSGSKEVRPVTQMSGKAAFKKLKNPVQYETEIKVFEKQGSEAEVLCTISKGYRHQVRCHLAWAGLPVKNDPLYNSVYKASVGQSEGECTKEICFEACSLEFPHPFTGEIVRYSVD